MFSIHNRLPFSPRSKTGEWFRSSTFEAKDTGKQEASLEIYDAIDSFWGVSAADFVGTVKGLDVSTIHVSINSPGGSYFDGMAIYNALRAHPAKVVTTVDGVAASIASVIWAAGDERKLHETAYLMVHKAWSAAVGNARELRETANVLERLDNSLVQVYSRIFRDTSSDEIEAMLDAETWLTAEEVSNLGAGTVIADDRDAAAAAHFDLSYYARVPEALQQSDESARAQDEAPASDAPAEEFVAPQDRMRLRARLAAMGVATESA